MAGKKKYIQGLYVSSEGLDHYTKKLKAGFAGGLEIGTVDPRQARVLVPDNGFLWDVELVPGTVRAFLRGQKIDSVGIPHLVSLLTRVTKKIGPMKKQGYMETLNHILAVIDGWSAGGLGALEFMYALERAGFLYNELSDYGQIIKRFYVLAKRHVCLDEWPPEAEVTETYEGRRGIWLVHFHLFLLVIERAMKDKGMWVEGQTPCSPTRLLVTLHVSLLLFEDQVTGEEFKGISVVERATFLFLSQWPEGELPHVETCVRRFGVRTAMRAAELIPLQRQSNAELTLVCRNISVLGELEPQQASALMREWAAVGRPGTLVDFQSAGGTARAWQEKLEEEKRLAEARRPTPAPQPVRRFEMPEERTQPMFKKQKRKKEKGNEQLIDFEELERKLEVVEVMQIHGEEKIRALVVRGFLRHGERLPPFAELRPREISKLWKLCRGPFASKRELTALVRALETAGVLKREGKRYRLHTPTARQPDARQQIEAIKTLITSAHARS